MKTWESWGGVELSAVSCKEKLISGLGGFLSMLVLMLISERALSTSAMPVIGSMAATAVLLFAVPHGLLSQPWPVLGGHGISALIGVACAKHIPYPWISGACAVGLSIGAMHQLKCIHPPGGATALTAVIGGNSIQALGFEFVVFPVLINAIILVLLAFLMNSGFRWRRYPTALFTRAQSLDVSGVNVEARPTHEEVLAAIRSIDSIVDVNEEDLILLSELLSAHSKKEGEVK